MNDFPAPVAIGGMGGSGTRLIAASLQKLGFFMGVDLNESLDNLWFTLLFKRLSSLDASEQHFNLLLNTYLAKMTGSGVLSQQQRDLVDRLAQQGSTEHPVEWLKPRAKSLLESTHRLPRNADWGWKEPNTHLFLPRLNANIPGLKYIHVARNGLDMAYSNNQNQLKLWGERLLGHPHDMNPATSLKYWVLIHQRIQRVGQTMGERFLFLDYDAYCNDPQQGVNKLLLFLGKPVTPRTLALLSEMVSPISIGRYKSSDTSELEPADIAAVRALGFDVLSD